MFVTNMLADLPPDPLKAIQVTRKRLRSGRRLFKAKWNVRRGRPRNPKGHEEGIDLFASGQPLASLAGDMQPMQRLTTPVQLFRGEDIRILIESLIVLGWAKPRVRRYAELCPIPDKAHQGCPDLGILCGTSIQKDHVTDLAVSFGMLATHTGSEIVLGQRFPTCLLHRCASRARWRPPRRSTP